MTLGRIVVYTRDIAAMAAFYTAHFDFLCISDETDRITELRPRAGGATLLLHPAAKSQKMGQVLLKFVFDVADVAGERARLIAAGLDVGPLHQAQGYAFANLKDPSGNPISLSSRAFKA